MKKETSIHYFFFGGEGDGRGEADNILGLSVYIVWSILLTEIANLYYVTN